jgi:hypothetical protein
MAISDDDLDACFSEDDFAVEATFAVSGPDVTVSGYFTEATDAVEMYGQDDRSEQTKLRMQDR